MRAYICAGLNSAGFKSLAHKNNQALSLSLSLSLSITFTLNMPLMFVVPSGCKHFSIANNASRIAFFALLWLEMHVCSGVFGAKKRTAQHKYIKPSALKAAKQLLC